MKRREFTSASYRPPIMGNGRGSRGPKTWRFSRANAQGASPEGGISVQFTLRARKPLQNASERREHFCWIAKKKSARVRSLHALAVQDGVEAFGLLVAGDAQADHRVDDLEQD